LLRGGASQQKALTFFSSLRFLYIFNITSPKRLFLRAIHDRDKL
jgi:hypothetical protein